MNRAQRRAMSQKQFRNRESDVVREVQSEMQRRDYVAYVYAMGVVGEALRRVEGLGPKRLRAIEDMILQVERERGIERLARPVDDSSSKTYPNYDKMSATWGTERSEVSDG